MDSLRQCAQLDRAIRRESQTRTIFDPEIRRLRAALRDKCEEALLHAYTLAQEHDVDSLLWKGVFYRPIEEFRRRIRAAPEGELKQKVRAGGGSVAAAAAASSIRWRCGEASSSRRWVQVPAAAGMVTGCCWRCCCPTLQDPLPPPACRRASRFLRSWRTPKPSICSLRWRCSSG